jgi:SNF2 family DNA or RNA helicase
MIKNLNKDWHAPLTPMDHQRIIFDRSKNMRYYALFWEMGTGKSKPIVDTICHLFVEGEIDGAVIISDNGCYMGWVDDHLPTNMPKEIPYRVASWSSYMHRKEKDEMEEIMVAKDDTLDFLCVNVEAFSGGRGSAAVERFIRNHYCLMCVDEATSIKNMRSQRTKTILSLGKLCDYRRIATGTPITQNPLDLFAMCEFLQQGILGFKTFLMFKSYYAVTVQIPSGRWHYDVIKGFVHLDQLTESIKPFSSRILKTECLDLPGKIYETIYVEQTIEQEEAYNSLRDTAVIQLQQGLLTSTSAIVTIMKLHQINCGHVKLDDDTVVDIPSNRIKVLLDELEKLSDQKVLIWCRFQRDVQLILAGIQERFSKTTKYGVHYYGKTTESERSLHLEKFQNDHNCVWFVGTASTGGKGINGLQNVCSYEIYYSNSYDREDRAQSEDRLDRKGQKNQVTIVDLVVRKSIDQKILDALKRKEDLAFQVLDKMREILS